MKLGFHNLIAVFTTLVLVACSGPQSISRAPQPDRTAIVPILMYHHVCDLAPNTDEVMRTWSVSVKDFTMQMEWLSQHGYQTVTLSEVAANLTSGAPLPEKPIVLTFDDGWDIGYGTVCPILQRLKMIGTFFVYPGAIGRNPGSGYMTWDQLKEMQTGGMDIQSHSFNHPHLRGVSPEGLRHEIGDCKTTLERELGHSVTAFAYPFGEFNEAIIQLVKDSGYRCAVGIEPGFTQHATELFSLHRTRISYGDTLDTFIQQVTYP